MVTHKDIQDPKKYTERDYKKFEYLLFANDTSAEVVQDIVMTLAHLPTKRAQDLLNRFKETGAAKEIEWLELAVEEGKSWYIWPENEQEERDMTALKLFFKNEDRIVEMMGECQTSEYKIKQYEIELEALEKLQKGKLSKEEREEIKYKIIAVKEMIMLEKDRLERTNQEIKLQDKINDEIKESIKTERYKKLNQRDIAGFYFDGEN